MRTIFLSRGKDKAIVEQVKPAAARPGPGRPSRAQQDVRREELLDTALDVFLERGFDQTTVEEVAVRVGMSKRTVYALHADKSALFKAAVSRAIERYTLPHEAIDAVSTGDLEGTLKAVGRLRIRNMASPNGVKLQRILAAQAYRFPELFRLGFADAAGPAVDYLTDLFARHEAAGEIRIAEPRRAANAYLSLVVGSAGRMIVSGIPLSEAEIEIHIAFTVSLFLDGVRRRP